MKICLINNLYKPWERGGAERIVQSQARGLSSLGHDVFIIATAPEETKSDDIYFLKSIFYNIGSYPVWQRLSWHIVNFFPGGRSAKVERILKKERPDLVITHNLIGMSMFLPKIVKRLGIRHFHVLHDIQLLHPSGLMFWGEEGKIDSLAARIYQAFARRSVGSPEVVISPSAWLLSEHDKRGFFKESEKVVAPNRFEPTSSPKTSIERDDSVFRFLFVGQMERHKGAELLLDAWTDMVDGIHSKPLSLTMVGEGSLIEGLKLRNAPKVSFVGKKSSEEVQTLMSSADCLVVPSLCYENSPTVIYEAAAVGLPVLAADLGGIPELIGVMGGRSFRPGDKDDLARAMASLVASPEELEAIRSKEASFSLPDQLLTIEHLAKGGDRV